MSMLRESADKLSGDAANLGNEERQTPLSGLIQGDALPEADGFGDGARQGNPVLSHGSLLIVAVAIVAAGSLYLMRASQGQIVVDEQARTLEAKIEQALVKLTNPQAMAKNDPLLSGNMHVLFKDTDAVVGMFTQDTSRHQVPLQSLKKNPFVLTLASTVFEAPGSTVDPAAAAIRHLTAEFRELRLETVMQGARPVAIINGKLVQPGDRLGSFTVTAIEGLSVKLQARDELFTLDIDMESSKPGRRR